MAMNEQFKTAFRSVVGDMTPAQVAEATGVSLAYVYAMLNQGRVPSPETLGQIADRLDVSENKRVRLFTAAKYASMLGESAKKLQRMVALDHLTPEQEEIARRLIEDPKRLDALAVILGDRVMEALAAGSRPATVGG